MHLKKACRRNYYYFYLSTVVIFLAWVGPSTLKKIGIDRSKLTEEQKRLPENAVSALKVADGLKVALFASEPMMTNPTNMDIDQKGRVWITEAYNYRINLHPDHPRKAEGDRILILEDTNGDGKADTSKVFYQDTSINAALGISVLGNKVIVSCSPYVFMLTDSDGDDKADKKEILFQGIGGEQHDHAIHAFTFGPDGKLYFNFGNAGDSILDKNGNIVRDVEGNSVNSSGKPYRQGMVFRCDMDGSNFEVLANNFRNNYEVAVDAFGNLWQSDNDDDGNRGVRINYILEYGNYGYTDEMTGAGWRARRVNMEDSIPIQHWHLNDPGVVPNLLQTGSGSPTGMLIYEGNMLPAVFQNQMIHSEPGHNIVRSYPVKKNGAGYTAQIVNIVESIDDEWFRPSDVCIAPDGSLFIADWYDPGVGGHQVGDLNRGRVFRVAPDVSNYEVPSFSINTTLDAIKALENPNLATRYLAWKKLHEQGTSVENDLVNIFNSSDNPRFRARAFWLLTKLPGKGNDYVNKALHDKNEDLRVAAFKAARELKLDLIPLVKEVVKDPSPQIRREALIALRHNTSSEAPGLWAELAQQYDGKDRWYLEALGISADKQWDSYFAAWKSKAGDNWNTAAGRDIVWRSRAKAALPLLASIIQDSNIDPEKNLKFFRAFDFHTDPSKQDILLSLLNGNHPSQKIITTYALLQLDTTNLAMTNDIKNAIDRSLEASKGTGQFLDLLARYKIKNKNPELLTMAVKNKNDELREMAAKILIANNGGSLVKSAVHKDTATAMTLVGALGGSEDPKVKDMLQSVLMDKSINLKVRQKATQMFGNGYTGQEKLMTLVSSKKLPVELKSTAQKVLLKAWRSDIQSQAKAFFNQGAGNTSFQPVATLIKLNGNSDNGKKMFTNVCSSCHQVNNNGIDFGPNLSEIGAKYAREGLYEAVLHPDAGIAFGYEGYVFKTKDGNQVLGYITSQSKEDLSVKMMGGSVSKIKKSDIVSQKPYEHSLMPTGLVSGMKQQEVVDLIEYLSALKKKS
ncbi:PVC-type heme-binding CxxCH protein [Segetibacter koreensis]|uniref:PVC-type heme-binding CxxCH protein n=1 Tax=Segetibacter koreensis TaxID=398037 RepID=UPI00036D769D|nr:PVC-type heme-binding CxxCH protein [Segetibacter koreensis]